MINVTPRLGRLLALFLWALLLTPLVSAQRQHTGAKRLRATGTATQTIPMPQAYTDTLTGAETTLVSLSGYEKTLRSRRESLMATNHAATDTAVASLVLTLDYRDSAQRQLHRRHIRLTADIPPAQTRTLDFPSWDRQLVYYYRLSPRPRAAAIPYDISVTLDTIFISVKDKF